MYLWNAMVNILHILGPCCGHTTFDPPGASRLDMVLMVHTTVHQLSHWQDLWVMQTCPDKEEHGQVWLRATLVNRCHRNEVWSQMQISSTHIIYKYGQILISIFTIIIVTRDNQYFLLSTYQAKLIECWNSTVAIDYSLCDPLVSFHCLCAKTEQNEIVCHFARPFMNQMYMGLTSDYVVECSNSTVAPTLGVYKSFFGLNCKTIEVRRLKELRSLFLPIITTLPYDNYAVKIAPRVIKRLCTDTSKDHPAYLWANV